MKRELESVVPDSVDDDSDEFGPMPIDAPNSEETTGNKKKLRILEFEELYLANLPSAELYEKSYMHRDIVTHILVSKPTEFVITGSLDGHVKFWKKMDKSIEFVKHYQAHLGPIFAMELSPVWCIYLSSILFEKLLSCELKGWTSLSDNVVERSHGEIFRGSGLRHVPHARFAPYLPSLFTSHPANLRRRSPRRSPGIRAVGRRLAAPPQGGRG